MAQSLNWDAVEFVILQDMEGMKFARVFEKHPKLTWNEWWFSPGSEPQFVGVNEPPSDGDRVNVNGADARDTVLEFLN